MEVSHQKIIEYGKVVERYHLKNVSDKLTNNKTEKNTSKTHHCLLQLQPKKKRNKA